MPELRPREFARRLFTTPKQRLAFGGGVALTVLIGLLLIAVAASGSENKGSPTLSLSPTASPGESGGLAAASSPPTEGAPLDLERETVDENLNMTSVGADDRFIIEKFGVDAPLTYRSVGLDGAMPNPDGPDDVAYYDFSAWPGKGGAPGKGGNAVFAGHVDSGAKPCRNGTVPPPCQAVLWDLNGLKVGD